MHLQDQYLHTMYQEMCWSAQVKTPHLVQQLLLVTPLDWVFSSQLSFPRSIGLLHWPGGRLKERHCGKHHPCIFHVLDGGPNFCSFSRDTTLFRFTIFSGRGNSNGFHLVLPTILALIGEPMWEFRQLLSRSIPIIHSETGETTTRWGQGTTGSTELNFSQNSIHYLTPISFYFNWKAPLFLGISQNQHQFRLDK